MYSFLVFIAITFSINNQCEDKYYSEDKLFSDENIGGEMLFHRHSIKVIFLIMNKSFKHRIFGACY